MQRLRTAAAYRAEPSLGAVQRCVSGAGGTGAALNHYKAMLAEGKQALPLKP